MRRSATAPLPLCIHTALVILCDSIFTTVRMMAQSKITLYVDIVSPFAYIAFHLLKARSQPCIQCVAQMHG